MWVPQAALRLAFASTASHWSSGALDDDEDDDDDDDYDDDDDIFSIGSSMRPARGDPWHRPASLSWDSSCCPHHSEQGARPKGDPQAKPPAASQMGQ